MTAHLGMHAHAVWNIVPFVERLDPCSYRAFLHPPAIMVGCFAKKQLGSSTNIGSSSTRCSRVKMASMCVLARRPPCAIALRPHGCVIGSPTVTCHFAIVARKSSSLDSSCPAHIWIGAAAETRQSKLKIARLPTTQAVDGNIRCRNHASDITDQVAPPLL